MGNVQRKGVFKKGRLKDGSKVSDGVISPLQNVQDILTIHKKMDSGALSPDPPPNGNSESNKESERPVVPSSPDALTIEEINHIKTTWKHIKNDINKILMEAFIILFTENADIKEKFFDFKNYSIEDLRKNIKGGSSLQRHIPRVARVMIKVMNNIGNLEELKDYFHILGKLHHQNGITLADLLPFGPVFLTCSVHYFPLSQRSNVDVTNSWIRLFLYMNETMRGGYPDIEYELNKDEKLLISKTFTILKDALSQTSENSPSKNVCLQSEFKNFALSKIYLPIFRVVYFKKEPISEELIIKHWELINTVVEKFISTMNDRPKMETTFVDLGHIHNKIGVRKNFLEVMGILFIKTIRLVLLQESEWNAETCSAWYHLFRVIIFQMKLGYSSEWKNEEVEESLPDRSRSHSSVTIPLPNSPVSVNRQGRSRSVTPSPSSQINTKKPRRISMEERLSTSLVYNAHRPQRNEFNANPGNVVSKSAVDITNTDNIPSIKLLPSNSREKGNAEADSPSQSLITKNRRQSIASSAKTSPNLIFPGQFQYIYQSCSSLATMERRRKSHQDYISASSLLTIPSPGSQRPRSKSDAARTLNFAFDGFTPSKSAE